jgi:hypothetical protein
MGRRGWLLVLELKLFCSRSSGLSASGPRTIRVLHVHRVSSSSCEFARGSFEVPKFCGRRFGRPSAWTSRTVRAARVAHGPSEDKARTVRSSRCASGGSVVFFGLSARGSRTVRPVPVDRPPQPRGPSAWAFAELLSPLLLWFHFRFGIVWGCT